MAPIRVRERRSWRYLLLEKGIFDIFGSQVTKRSDRVFVLSIEIAFTINPYFFSFFPILAFPSHRNHLLFRKYSDIDYCFS